MLTSLILGYLILSLFATLTIYCACRVSAQTTTPDSEP